jgi:hypothetical protein
MRKSNHINKFNSNVHASKDNTSDIDKFLTVFLELYSTNGLTSPLIDSICKRYSSLNHIEQGDFLDKLREVKEESNNSKLKELIIILNDYRNGTFDLTLKEWDEMKSKNTLISCVKNAYDKSIEIFKKYKNIFLYLLPEEKKRLGNLGLKETFLSMAGVIANIQGDTNLAIEMFDIDLKLVNSINLTPMEIISFVIAYSRGGQKQKALEWQNKLENVLLNDYGNKLINEKSKIAAKRIGDLLFVIEGIRQKLTESLSSRHENATHNLEDKEIKQKENVKEMSPFISLIKTTLEKYKLSYKNIPFSGVYGYYLQGSELYTAAPQTKIHNPYIELRKLFDSSKPFLKQSAENLIAKLLTGLSETICEEEKRMSFQEARLAEIYLNWEELRRLLIEKLEKADSPKDISLHYYLIDKEFARNLCIRLLNFGNSEGFWNKTDILLKCHILYIYAYPLESYYRNDTSPNIQVFQKIKPYLDKCKKGLELLSKLYDELPKRKDKIKELRSDITTTVKIKTLEKYKQEINLLQILLKEDESSIGSLTNDSQFKQSLKKFIEANVEESLSILKLSPKPIFEEDIFIEELKFKVDLLLNELNDYLKQAEKEVLGKLVEAQEIKTRQEVSKQEHVNLIDKLDLLLTLPIEEGGICASGEILDDKNIQEVIYKLEQAEEIFKRIEQLGKPITKEFKNRYTILKSSLDLTQHEQDEHIREIQNKNFMQLDSTKTMLNNLIGKTIFSIYDRQGKLIPNYYIAISKDLAQMVQDEHTDTFNHLVKFFSKEDRVKIVPLASGAEGLKMINEQIEIKILGAQGDDRIFGKAYNLKLGDEQISVAIMDSFTRHENKKSKKFPFNPELINNIEDMQKLFHTFSFTKEWIE